MQLLIISGFLGSGKTTILMPLVKKLTANGKKVAIIENEVGKKGVDDIFLKKHGLMVKEIFSGCICCSLRLDLLKTLMVIEKEYAPDIVILEPSGIAAPKLLLSALQGYEGNIESKFILSIVDPERFPNLLKMNIPIAVDGIKNGDLVVINKIDLISSTKLAELRTSISNINDAIKVIEISMLENRNFDMFFDEVQSSLVSSKEKEELLLTDLEKKGQTPSVYSLSSEYSSNDICLTETELKKHFADKIYTISKELENNGATLIGNLKLIIKSDNDGYVLVSTTSFERYPDINGTISQGYKKLTLNLNAIIYGITKDKLTQIIDNSFIN